MTSDLRSNEEIVEALKHRMRVGEGLSAPYARKWAIGGCEACCSLWSYPHDALSDFADALTALDISIALRDDAIAIETGGSSLWIAVNGKARNATRASEFLVGRTKEDIPVVVVNAPEVVIKLLEAYGSPPESVPQTEIIQVGFPGIKLEDRTYVGSWQWNVHSEARGEEFVHRTANAILTAIQTKEAERGE